MVSGLLEDLIEETLSRVPARSLKRLRSTCKQWNTLFNDVRFTKKHCVKAPREFLVLISTPYRFYSMSVNLSGIHNNMDPSIEVKGELSPNSYDHSFISIKNIFHCDGLLLCTAKTVQNRDTLVVYNPCIGKTRRIEPRTVYNALKKTYALGYENNKSCCDNYKILKFSEVLGVTSEYEIYELKSNSWRVLDGIITDWKLSRKGNMVSLKGDTYWTASDMSRPNKIQGSRQKKNWGHREKFILKFDFTRERFQCLRLPFKCLSHGDTVVLSTVREEKLAVLYQKDFTLEIWLSNNIDDETENVSWSMFFTVDLYKFIYASMITNFMEKKVDLLKYEFTPATSFMVDEENKVVVCYDMEDEDKDEKRFRIYIVGEDEFRKVDHLLGDDHSNQIKYCKPRLSSYVPSLVQI